MSAPARILDANANRAREALRVLEDTARFALDDAALTAEIKRHRHEFQAALARLPAGWMEANRDSAGDVGASVTAAGEYERAGLADIVSAAGKRLGEALRVIEETAKMFEPALAREVEAIRYRLYDTESALHRRLGSGRARQWRVCVLLTESLCARPWRDVLRAVIDGGADCVQIREKDMGAADLLTRVEAVAQIARPAGVTVVVNDRVDVALAAAADGAHVGQRDLPLGDARRLAGRTLLLGASTHSLAEANVAVEAGADYCGVGAMFVTGTKSQVVPRGPAFLEAFIRRYPDVPHLAIGGITPANVGRLVDVGAKGVAVSRAVCADEHPERVVTTLRNALLGVGAAALPR